MYHIQGIILWYFKIKRKIRSTKIKVPKAFEDLKRKSCLMMKHLKVLI